MLITWTMGVQGYLKSPDLSADGTERMAEPEASRTHAGTDKDDAQIPELASEGPEPPGSWPATSSFPRRRRRRHQPGYGAHESSSSLADDEESLGGSLSELRHPICPV